MDEVVTNPSVLHSLLESHGIQLKKSLSQNFLIDSNVVKKVVSKVEITEGDDVFEIGPGVGALTREAIKEGANLIVVEKDRRMIPILETLPGCKVVMDDILEFDFSSLTKDKYKVMSAVPYSITSPILERLIDNKEKFTSAILIVQDEVAIRMAAQPNNKDYGALTVFLNCHSKVEYLFKIKKTCFYPKPNVESAVVKLTFISRDLGFDAKEFGRFVKAGFSKRRKQIKNSLSQMFNSEHLSLALKEFSIPEEARIEQLSFDQLSNIFRYLDQLKPHSLSSAG